MRRTLDELPRIGKAWDAIGARVQSPMQQRIWAEACIESIERVSKLTLLTAGPESAPTAAALLCRAAGSSVYHWPGTAELGEPMDFAYADSLALDELCESVLGLGACVRLDRLPIESPTLAALDRAYRRRGRLILRPATAYPTIALDESWREPERHFNARRCADLRRAARRAAQAGEPAFEFHVPDAHSVEPLLQAALDVEHAGWKGRRGTAMKVDPVCGAFFKNYAARAAAAGCLRLALMKIAGRPAAMQLGVACGGRFWLLKMGYDEAFARCSPGTLLLLESVRRAALEGFASYELLGAPENWTALWTHQIRACVAVYAYPANWRGLSRIAADCALYGRRRVFRLLRTGAIPR